MALWGKTDNTADRPNWIDLGNYPEGTELIFVDADEARVTANKERGIHNPGWWLVYSYEDTNGSIRHKNELVVAMSSSETSTAAGDDDNDDNNAVDFDFEIGFQNSTIYIVSPGTVTIPVEVGSNGDNVEFTYEWYDASNDEVIEGATAQTLVLEDVTAPQSYYVVVSGGGKSYTSSTVQVLED